MIMEKEGMETRVLIVPYEESSIYSGQFLQTGKMPIIITSVKDYEDKLVRIALPPGESVVANADQLINAIRKCVL